MKDKLTMITGDRYYELLVEELLKLLYEKGVMSKEDYSKMKDIIGEIISEELTEALNAARE